MRIIDDLAFDEPSAAKLLEDDTVLVPHGALYNLHSSAQRDDIVIMEILIYITERVSLQHAVCIEGNDDVRKGIINARIQRIRFSAIYLVDNINMAIAGGSCLPNPSKQDHNWNGRKPRLL